MLTDLEYRLAKPFLPDFENNSILWMLLRTFAKKVEKGKPLSREKAQARRDAHARSPNVEKIRVEISVHTMAVVAPLDLVALRKIWIIG